MSFLLSDFDYDLPEHRIALHPIEPKDHAKLLVYKNKEIKDTYFYSIAEEIPENSILVINNTKVIPARLWFKKPNSEVVIEVFCLSPVGVDIQQAMRSTQESVWECMIGNKKRWKNTILTQFSEGIILHASYRKPLVENTFEVHFTWEPKELTFSEVLQHIGQIPLPPYLQRKTEDKDKINYQTIFADKEGAVAAPTAGLHFTESVLKTLQDKNISLETLTLHVGAGTFMPVKTNQILEHKMHYEKIEVYYSTLMNLYKNSQNNIIAVGTTCLRTLESVYWFGVRLLNKENIHLPYLIDDQYISIKNPIKYSFRESLEAVLSYLEKLNVATLEGYTNLYILPHTKVQSINGLITNFHQPKSTLLMLISAIVGEDWKRIYAHALSNGYRFLSYGDANLYYLDTK